jgi:hypothetical protein
MQNQARFHNKKRASDQVENEIYNNNSYYVVLPCVKA